MPDPIVDDLQTLDHQVEAAVVAKDLPFLESILAEDFRFVHGTGRVDSKAPWLDSLRTGRASSASRTVSELDVEPHGDTALTSGRISVVSSDGRPYSIRFARAYVRRDNRWRLVSHHTTLQMPAPPPPPVDFRLTDALAPTTVEQLATGFAFTEGPVWHPDGYLYFVDIRSTPSRLLRLKPGGEPEVVRADNHEGNGTTFDAQGNLVLCESGNRRVVRLLPDGTVAPIAVRFEGKRLNRPNDVVCASDGSLYFTDPGLRVPLGERELPSAVYRVAPDGALTMVAECEYPNGLAFSPDERTLYVANSRWTQYIHTLALAPDGTLQSRGVFADMSTSDPPGTVWNSGAPAPLGVPDGMKVDSEGRVYCTGTGGIWVFAPDGAKLGLIPIPEVPANLAFGGADLRTVYVTARTSVYSFRINVPGLPGHPWRGG